MKATIYIPDAQSGIYEKAKAELGESISATFLRCLERELETKRLKQERIIVEVHDPKTERVTKKAFEGRWLVDGEEHFFDPDNDHDGAIQGGGKYSVALTKKGGIVVCEWDKQSDEVEAFQVHDDFAEFESAEVDNRYPMYPASLIAAVGSEVGIEPRIEELDI